MLGQDYYRHSGKLFDPRDLWRAFGSGISLDKLVLPDGFHRIRHFGLQGSSIRKAIRKMNWFNLAAERSRWLCLRCKATVKTRLRVPVLLS